MAAKEEICPVMFEDFGQSDSLVSLTLDDLTTEKGGRKTLELSWAQVEGLLSASVMQVKGILDAMWQMRESMKELLEGKKRITFGGRSSSMTEGRQ